ncbi:MAG: 2-C-methyl-D-erythritol 2,4-cyclodiphosphate synthase [Clostridia bacterium]|nr:2-C-methyl-D-erythritol 2,4-cyclodiphosphate synthase [Clostridia bacterium]
MRIGHGYDVHRFVEGRPLFLGGVEIPFEKGLLGHSDADVLLHAICDALLGAAALPDIGRLFPDNDDKYKGIDSKLILKEVGAKIFENGYCIVNIDATVIAQKPKLSPYVEAMRIIIAEALNIDVSQINVKATTEEGLGFTGELLGISAHCVCIID